MLLAGPSDKVFRFYFIYGKARDLRLVIAWKNEQLEKF